MSSATEIKFLNISFLLPLNHILTTFPFICILFLKENQISQKFQKKSTILKLTCIGKNIPIRFDNEALLHQT